MRGGGGRRPRHRDVRLGRGLVAAGRAGVRATHKAATGTSACPRHGRRPALGSGVWSRKTSSVLKTTVRSAAILILSPKASMRIDHSAVKHTHRAEQILVVFNPLRKLVAFSRVWQPMPAKAKHRQSVGQERSLIAAAGNPGDRPRVVGTPD